MANYIGTDETWGIVRGKLNSLFARPSSRKVAIFGDSISDQNSDPNITNGKGYMSQARAIAFNRFDFDDSLNFGIAGQNTAQMLARVNDVIAARPARVFFLGGTNDYNYGSGLTVDQTVANIIAIFDALSTAGIYVDWCPILPRSYDNNAGGTNLTTIQDYIHSVNHRIRRHLRDREDTFVTVVPLEYYLTDRSSASGAPVTAAFQVEPTGNSGLLHPIVYGAQLMAIPLAAYYSDIFPSLPRRITSNNDVLSASNPWGAIRSNPLMTGTTGTVGTGVTGTVATGWSVARNSGSTLTATVAKVAQTSPTGGEVQSIILGGGTGGASFESVRLIQVGSSIPTTGLTAGDKVALIIEVEQQNLVNVRTVKAHLQTYLTGASPAIVTGLGGSGYAYDREYPNLVRRIETPPLTIQSPGSVNATNDTLTTQLVIEADCSGAGVSGTILIRSVELVKVA